MHEPNQIRYSHDKFYEQIHDAWTKPDQKQMTDQTDTFIDLFSWKSHIILSTGDVKEYSKDKIGVTIFQNIFWALNLKPLNYSTFSVTYEKWRFNSSTHMN